MRHDLGMDKLQVPHRWAAYSCTACDAPLLVQGRPGELANNAEIVRSIPEVRRAALEIPDPARTYLQQAYDTLQSPDAAAVMAGSAVDAMLKYLGLVNGSVYERINQAVQKNLLTDGMAKWAHEVRLGANRPRHADSERPHVSFAEAKLSVEFADALGQFLFVLASRVSSGIEDAKKAE